MNFNLKKLAELICHYLDEAQLSDDEDQIIVLCSILDDVESFEKELRQDLATFEPLPIHDVCCIHCLEKGQYMTYKKILGE